MITSGALDATCDVASGATSTFTAAWKGVELSLARLVLLVEHV